MAEQLRDIRLTYEDVGAAAKIANSALYIVDTQYGRGFPTFEGGEQSLAYHNGHHSRAVSYGAARVGEVLGFNLPELVTTGLAAKAHDIVQLKPRGQMEAESAEWLAENIRRRGMPGVMAEAGALAILGTEPIIEGGRLVGQMATRLHYPSKSAERVSLAVACGDFGRVLTPEGPYQSSKLYQEIKGVGPDEAPPMGDFARFTEGQIILREGYRFPAPKAERILATHRREVVEHGKELLRLIGLGDITTWQEVEDFDRRFMREHSR